MSVDMLKDSNDQLISELRFKDSNAAPVINSRNLCSFQAVGSNSYSPSSGVRIIRFQTSGDDWLDPSSLRITFDVVKGSAVVRMIHYFQLTVRMATSLDLADYHAAN